MPVASMRFNPLCARSIWPSTRSAIVSPCIAIEGTARAAAMIAKAIISSGRANPFATLQHLVSKLVGLVIGRGSPPHCKSYNQYIDRTSCNTPGQGTQLHLDVIYVSLLCADEISATCRQVTLK